MPDSYDMPPPEGGSGWMINHLPAAMWQRRKMVLVTTALIFIASVIAAYALPTMYRSNATLLVQSQELPSSIVESPVSGAVGQRLAKIREQVLSRGDLITLIEQNDLYAEERRKEPLSVVVAKMREATMVGALANDIGAASGQDKTIAINLSFDYRDAAKAQAVMQSYVTNFMRIDSDDVEDQANLSVRFLEDQARKLSGQLSELEGQITALKARNGAALAGSGMPSMVDTGSYSAQITALENQNRMLLASSRKTERDPELVAAESAYAAVRTRYNDSHPDVALARQRLEQARIAASRSTGQSADMAFIQEQIAANNATIASLNAQRNSALGRASAAMAGSARAPAILEQAMQLESRASTIREQYRVVSSDLLKAQNSARMAGEQRAERLSLVNAPDLPDAPLSPNRPLLIGGGLAAGLMLGLFLALAAEFVGKPLRSPNQLEGLGLPVLGLVPILGEPSLPWYKNILPWRRRRAEAMA